MQGKINLKIQSREGILYQGTVISVTGRNVKGTFDILTNHENFITLLDETLIIRESEGSTKEMSVHQAVLRVKNNNIEIFVGVNA